MQTPETVLRKLAAQSTWREVGARLGLPPSYLHDVANGKRPASDKLLAKLGLGRKVIYYRLQGAGR